MDKDCWTAIAALGRTSLSELFGAGEAGGVDRLKLLAHESCGIRFDFAKTHLTADAITAFEGLARAQGFAARREALFGKVAGQYATMSVDELKTLLVEDKWMTTVARDVDSELDRVSQALAGRIKQLGKRYETPLPKLAAEVASLSTRIEEHLRKMGAL